ncbi:hypothetical protein PV10_05446 [Exophiala mesophila]|uniref:Uncharacterized protein n=1 Tax=Exophiala mesophila TaxID=212818 RepID=A0A0D1ZVI9_EXOME|nr:uncharacterized protein PV10_05446 [Exophiala mesophila]KIV90838.1 hypothetical protein PV10_05446 [Exophiala mesophila]
MIPTVPLQMADVYDPTTSPHRPLSPRSKDALFPNSSIIAINPTTGRPVLPHLPTLPSRLRLSDDEAELELESGHQSQHYGQGTHQYDDGQGHDDTQNSYTRSHRHPQQPHDHIASGDTDMSPIAGMGPSTHTAAQLRAEEEAEIEADEERRDRERIERLLREMMARQRARAKSKTGVTDSHTPTSSANRRGGRRRAHEVGVGIDMDASGLEAGDDTESEAEKEELMSLITASLRREVAKADDENWMFGDLGAPGSGMSRDEGMVD